MPRTSWTVAAVALALAASAAVDVASAATTPAPPHVRITGVADRVELTNEAGRAVDLRDWTLTGPGQQPYALTGTLHPGATTVVPAGNQLGTLILRDPRGVTAHACRTSRIRVSMPCPALRSAS